MTAAGAGSCSCSITILVIADAIIAFYEVVVSRVTVSIKHTGNLTSTATPAAGRPRFWKYTGWNQFRHTADVCKFLFLLLFDWTYRLLWWSVHYHYLHSPPHCRTPYILSRYKLNVAITLHDGQLYAARWAVKTNLLPTGILSWKIGSIKLCNIYIYYQ